MKKSTAAPWDKETKNFRHAELICRDELALEPYLRKIVYRNEIERMTLLSILQEKNNNLVEKYSSIIVADEWRYDSRYNCDSSVVEVRVQIGKTIFVRPIDYRNPSNIIAEVSNISRPITLKVWLDGNIAAYCSF